MKLHYFLAAGTVISYLVIILFQKKPRIFYLLYVILLLPVMDLPITPENMGSYKVFDGISCISFLILFNEFLYVSKKHLKYHILFIFLFLVLIFGALNSNFIGNSLRSTLSFFPVFIYAKSFINEYDENKNFKKNIIFCLKLVAIISIIFLIIQIIFGLKFTFYPNLNRNTLDFRGVRYPSYFHDPQKYEQFLVMLSFVFLINEKQIDKPSLKNYLAFAIVFVAMLATGGRSPIIGLFAGLLLLFFFLGVRYKFILLSFILLGVIILLFFSSSLLILQRSATFNEDYLFRASLWQESNTIFQNHPVLGIGTGNFLKFVSTFSDNYFVSAENDVVFFDQPESGYWLILTEVGLLGFTGFFLFIILPIIQSIKTYFNLKKNLVSIIFIASIISWLFSFISIYSLSDKRILIIVITMVCLIITTSKIESST